MFVRVFPEKSQFKDGESFYSNLAHEMAHSAGAEDQLNRLKPSSFGSKDYAREELATEISVDKFPNELDRVQWLPADEGVIEMLKGM